MQQMIFKIKIYKYNKYNYTLRSHDFHKKSSLPTPFSNSYSNVSSVTAKMKENLNLIHHFCHIVAREFWRYIILYILGHWEIDIVATSKWSNGFIFIYCGSILLRSASGKSQSQSRFFQFTYNVSFSTILFDFISFKNFSSLQ